MDEFKKEATAGLKVILFFVLSIIAAIPVIILENWWLANSGEDVYRNAFFLVLFCSAILIAAESR